MGAYRYKGIGNKMAQLSGNKALLPWHYPNQNRPFDFQITLLW
jgi:hypothetical protein